MLDIEKVNGILIAPDGSFKSFGTYKDAPVSELTDDNFHDSSFKKDVANDEWFINLQKDIELIILVIQFIGKVLIGLLME